MKPGRLYPEPLAEAKPPQEWRIYLVPFEPI
jgi:hypothetical protein